jgi:hypothetical protein
MTSRHGRRRSRDGVEPRRNPASVSTTRLIDYTATGAYTPRRRRPPSDGCHTAVNGQIDAGYEAGLVRRKK